MPAFAFRAVDTAGRQVRGREEAPGEPQLTRALEERGLVVLAVEPTESGGGGRLAHARASGLISAVEPTESGGGGRGGRRQVIEVTRALASLLRAGMPLARALQTATHVAGGAVPAVLQQVRRRVERGDGFADALAEHPRLFPPLYVGLVRAGERSRALEAALTRPTEQREREEELRGRMVSALIYPALLAVAGGTAVLVLLFFVLPRFVGLLEGTGAALPRSTRCCSPSPACRSAGGLCCRAWRRSWWRLRRPAAAPRRVAASARGRCS